MEGIDQVEYWRQKCHDYEWMYKEQKDICDGYRKIIEELKSEMKDLKIENTKLNWATKGNSSSLY